MFPGGRILCRSLPVNMSSEVVILPWFRLYESSIGLALTIADELPMAVASRPRRMKLAVTRQRQFFWYL